MDEPSFLELASAGETRLQTDDIDGAIEALEVTSPCVLVNSGLFFRMLWPLAQPITDIVLSSTATLVTVILTKAIFPWPQSIMKATCTVPSNARIKEASSRRTPTWDKRSKPWENLIRPSSASISSGSLPS